MNWDDLRFVLELERHHTLSEAAKSLHVTHTTVSRRLAALESQLGVRLFDRTPGGYVPTHPGLELIEVAQGVEASILRVEGSVKGQDTELEGPLRISTLDYLFEAFADVFASFCERYPGIELTVTCDETEVSLFRRQADVALRMTNSPPETLLGRKVGEVRFAVYGHRAFADGRDWNDLPWLHWDERLDAYARWMDGWLAQVAPAATVPLRLGESTLARRAALRQGIGVHPLPCLEGDHIEGLVRIGPTLDKFTRALWVLTLPAMRNTRRVRAFTEHVADALADHAMLADPGQPRPLAP